MAKKIQKETKKQLVKNAKEDIRKKIEGALTDLKKDLGEKKFLKRVKKASAIFSSGLVITGSKDKQPKKKQTKKSADKLVLEQNPELAAV